MEGRELVEYLPVGVPCRPLLLLVDTGENGVPKNRREIMYFKEFVFGLFMRVDGGHGWS